MLASVDNALVAAFGHPRNVPDGVELRSDHGSVYTGADAQAFALRRGVDQTFAPAGRPAGNAVAERTLRTRKEECVWLEDWRSAPDVRTALDAWRRSVNDVRPHPSLSWLPLPSSAHRDWAQPPRGLQHDPPHVLGPLRRSRAVAPHGPSRGCTRFPTARVS